MTFVNWKLAGCLAIAGMLMFPLGAEAKNKAGKAAKAAKVGKHKANKNIVKLADLPKAAADAITGADKDATVKLIVKIDGKGKNAGKVFYRAHLVKGNQRASMKVDAAGNVIKQPKWHDKVAKAGKAHKAHKAKKAAA